MQMQVVNSNLVWVCQLQLKKKEDIHMYDTKPGEQLSIDDDLLTGAGSRLIACVRPYQRPLGVAGSKGLRP